MCAVSDEQAVQAVSHARDYCVSVCTSSRSLPFGRVVRYVCVHESDLRNSDVHAAECQLSQMDYCDTCGHQSRCGARSQLVALAGGGSRAVLAHFRNGRSMLTWTPAISTWVGPMSTWTGRPKMGPAHVNMAGRSQHGVSHVNMAGPCRHGPDP